MKRCLYIKMSERAYRKQKRKQFAALRKAMDDLSLGCYYLPTEAYKQICVAKGAIEAAYRHCKPWWRKA